MATKLVTILYEPGDQVVATEHAWDEWGDLYVPQDTILEVEDVKKTNNEDWNQNQLLKLAGWNGWYWANDFALYEEEQDAN
jgi:ABC-type branched-subunit amino acid transport system substrate-binding protein